MNGLHTCLFRVIGLDAADVRRLLRHEDLHEFRQTGFELGGCLEGADTEKQTTDGRWLGRDAKMKRLKRRGGDAATAEEWKPANRDEEPR